MMYYKQWLSVLLFIILTRITVQKDEVNEKNREEIKPKAQRRFIEDLDDKEWHISHLRDMEFDTEDCEEDTFENKAKKYRETLKNDAALVEFVSGDAIQVNEEDVIKGKCKKNIRNIFKIKEKTGTKSALNVTQIKKEQEANATSFDGEVKTATVSVKVDDQDKTLKNDSNIRRSEYQFSSAEYYDEVPDFDPSICPDTVDVITLEIDQLRNYDVECEAIIEWRSLE